MVETYKLPEFLNGRIEKPTYVKWLARKASTHAKRDRSRLGRTISVQSYKQAIHNAVETSKGVDWYTGEILEWEKISSYDNALAKKHRSNYKASLALLPTVDHVLNSEGTMILLYAHGEQMTQKTISHWQSSFHSAKR